MTPKPHVLFAASECREFFKSGGLADVVSALPNALIKENIRVSTILPYYSVMANELKSKAECIATFSVNIGGNEEHCGLIYIKLDNKDFYFIENDDHFNRDILYGYGEADESFIFFSFAILTALNHIDKVDIIHCHDWQVAAIPVLLNAHYRQYDLYKEIKTVFTIHNLRFQGKFPLNVAEDMLGIDSDSRFYNELEFEGCINLLKGAIYNSNYVTTVSQTYADEIKTDYYGEGLEHVLNENSFKLSGIVNGLDVDSFNPNGDKKIYQTYNTLDGKAKNKKPFANQYNLNDDDSMLISIVTRLDRQKGLDLILHVIDDIMQMPVNFVLLGTGEMYYEKTFSHIESKYGNRCKCFIMYNDEVARKIYAASDLFLMPSDFEPCGLSQLIAMRYGTLPLVRETGGLKDTVIPYNVHTNEGTGFSFTNYNAHDMLNVIKFAFDLYTNQRDKWDEICIRNMNLDFSWVKSAQEYIELYTKLVNS